jgi:hypothetical protein
MQSGSSGIIPRGFGLCNNRSSEIVCSPEVPGYSPEVSGSATIAAVTLIQSSNE